MNTSESDQSSLSEVISIGQVLAEKRQEWGLSVQDVAAQLNLGVSTIAALEADDFASLPGSTFVKGYIRSYAKLLQLDGEQMLDHVHLQPEPVTEIPSNRADLKMKGRTRNRTKTGAGRFFKGLFWLVLLVGLIGFGLTQLPRLGVDGVSEWFKQLGTNEQIDDNQIVIPGLAPENEPDSEQTNGVLIPID